MRYLKVLALVALFFFSMLFFIQNNGVLTQELILTLKVFGWEYQSGTAPFYLLILLSFVIGAVMCTLYFFLERLRLSQMCKQLRKDMERLERESSSLRSSTMDTSYSTGDCSDPVQN